MTLKTCKELLAHYERVANSEAPKGHVNWADVVANARARAELMKKRIAEREGKDGNTQRKGSKKQVASN